jgi:translation initiation factor IF-2
VCSSDLVETPAAAPEPAVDEAALAEAAARAERERAEHEAAQARAQAEAEARLQQEEAQRKLREEEESRQRAAVEAAERAKREHEERLKNDPIYRAKMEAEGSRRRAEENLRRAAEARRAAPPPAPAPAAPAAKKPAADRAAAPADAKPAGDRAADRDRDRGGHHRQELHVAEGKGGKRDKKKRKPTGQVRVENTHQFEKPVAPIVREVEVPEGISVAELANRMAVKATELIKVMMRNGIMATINQTLDQDTAVLMVEELGHKAKVIKGTELDRKSVV